MHRRFIRGTLTPRRVSTRQGAPSPAGPAHLAQPALMAQTTPWPASGKVGASGLERSARYRSHCIIKPLMRGTTLLFEGALACYGFRHRYVTTSVGRMHALVAPGTGKGPPVVVIPGLSSNIAEYGRALWQLRCAGSCVIALDLPGHGRSAVPQSVSDAHFNIAIRETLQALCPRPAVLIGHSLGGYLAIRYALACGQAVEKLLLVCPVGAPFTEAERRTHVRLFGVHTEHAAREVTERAWSKALGRRRMIVAAVRARLGSPIVQSVVRSDIFNAYLTPARLGTLRMPVAIFWGADDALLPLRQLEFFHTHIKTITYAQILPGAGHGILAPGRQHIIKPVVAFIQAHQTDARRSFPGVAPVPEQV